MMFHTLITHYKNHSKFQKVIYQKQIVSSTWGQSIKVVTFTRWVKIHGQNRLPGMPSNLRNYTAH